MEAKKEDSKKNIIITLCSTKGGVGKTTLAANLAGFLADLSEDNKVLLVDGDIQPTLSGYYQIETKAQAGLTQLIKNSGDPQKTISKTMITNLDIVCSDDPNAELQTWINSNPSGRVLFIEALSKIRENYDYIIIDSQGANEPLQHVTVLAADILLSPIPPDLVSSQEFKRGTLRMIQQLEPFGSMIGSSLGQMYGLVYKKDNTTDAQHFSDELTSSTFLDSKSRIRILSSYIPHLVAYKNAATAHLPVHRLDLRAKKDICALVSEILPVLTTDCKNFMEGK